MDSLQTDRPEVSVVIPVSGDDRDLRPMLENVNKLSRSVEVIVVCPPMTRISYPHAYASWVRAVVADSYHTYDDGRSLGAFHARGDCVLFLDERILVSPETMNQYIAAVRSGADVVLTASRPSPAKKGRKATCHAYRLLNHLLGRVELAAATMSRVPYACSRKALDVIGYESLRTPPVAYAKAAVERLAIASVAAVPFIQQVPGTVTGLNKGSRHILHDHAEAIRLLLQVIGSRGGLPDGDRYRSLLLVPGQLHLRSVFYQQPSEHKRGKRGGKRKAKKTNTHKKK